MMSQSEKIKVIDAASRGEKIQCRNGMYISDVLGKIGWPSLENWTTRSHDVNFNFSIYDYRVAPKNSIQILTRKRTGYEVTANNDGSVTFGCETIEKRDVDAIFALRDKGKLCF